MTSRPIRRHNLASPYAAELDTRCLTAFMTAFARFTETPMTGEMGVKQVQTGTAAMVIHLAPNDSLGWAWRQSRGKPVGQ